MLPISTINVNASQYNSIKNQLVKLNVSFEPAFKNITLRQWISLQLLEHMNTKETSLHQLFIHLCENPIVDLNKIKELFSTIIKNPELEQQRTKFVQLQLILMLHKDALSVSLDDIFGQSTPPSETSHGIEKTFPDILQNLGKMLLLRINAMISEQEKTIKNDVLIHQMVAAYKNGTLDKFNSKAHEYKPEELKLLVSKMDSDIHVLKKTRFAKELIMSSQSGFDQLRINRYYLAATAGVEAMMSVCDSIIAIGNSDFELKSEFTKKANDAKHKIERLLKKRFKLEKKELKVVQVAFQNEMNQLLTIVKGPVAWNIAFHQFTYIQKYLNQLDQNSSQNQILASLENIRKRLDSQAFKNEIAEIDRKAKERDQLENMMIHEEKGQRTAMSHDSLNDFFFCKFATKTLYDILAKKIKEDTLDIFSLWEDEPTEIEPKAAVEEEEDIVVDAEIEENDTELTSIPQTSQLFDHLASLSTQQMIQSLHEYFLAKIPNQVGKTQRLQEDHQDFRDHIYLAGCGFAHLLRAFEQRDWQQLGVIYPMLLLDWHTILEAKLDQGKERTHSLVLQSRTLKLTDDEKSLMFELDQGLIWSRYPESSLFRQNKIQSNGQFWLMHSLEFLTEIKNPTRFPEFLKYVVTTHFKVMAYVKDKYTKGHIEEHFLKQAEALILERVTIKAESSIIANKVINKTVLDMVSQIDHILSNEMVNKSKKGIIHSALKDVKFHLLRLQGSLQFNEDSVWVERNLKNIQWIIEQLYVCRYYMKKDEQLHIHDFASFQTLLNDQDNYNEEISKYNYGTSIHYPNRHAKNNALASKFCQDLQKEKENSTWGPEKKPMNQKSVEFINEGLRLTQILLNRLIAEGHLEDRAVVIVK